MNIHQFTINYVREQDRVLVRVRTTSDEEFRLWLTRRLLLGFLPLLRQTMAQHGVGADHAERLVMPDDFSRQAMAEFQKVQALEQADFKTPYKTDGAALPLTEEPLLVREISVTPLAQGRVQLNFVEQLEDAEGLYAASGGAAQRRRSFQITLEPKLMQGWLHLLSKAYALTEWQGAPAQPEEPALPGANVPTANKPKYLN